MFASPPWADCQRQTCREQQVCSFVCLFLCVSVCVCGSAPVCFCCCCCCCCRRRCPFVRIADCSCTATSEATAVRVRPRVVKSGGVTPPRTPPPSQPDVLLTLSSATEMQSRVSTRSPHHPSPPPSRGAGTTNCHKQWWKYAYRGQGCATTCS